MYPPESLMNSWKNAPHCWPEGGSTETNSMGEQLMSIRPTARRKSELFGCVSPRNAYIVRVVLR